MVMSSAQIAELNGAFQSQSMAQMQYSGMVGPRPYSGESMAGSLANFGAAVAPPMFTLGMAAMGVDPISRAFSGGMAGFARGGVAGAIGGGMAAAAVPMLGMSAVGWGAGQIYEGMQQQQALNSALRSSFRQRNQFGGAGFTSTGMAQIGTEFRAMQGQMGPNGEMVGFEELTRLAANMGRMGMAEGVRNAKDFSEKFKQMVNTLKVVATEMGTSLEEAQKMMLGMKSSGIFRQSEAARMAGSVRLGAAAGGLAATELTSIMGIGSQVSRSIGGLGRAGAQGGLETLTNIGVAQRMGVISEASIYNATGLTGAEGRQALATQQLQTSAAFLKSGLGRRFLASMAGKDGSLDMADADAMMAGGVSTGETMQRAHENLRGVGRANFIRNEGRLRGEALAKFGGLAPAIALRSWLGERGIDINADDDRAMLFAQRRMGVGRDEADVMIQQAKALPRIMQQRMSSELQENLGQKIDIRSRQVGVEGLKRKFDHAWDSVTSSIKNVGARMYSEMSEAGDRMLSRLTDTYVTQYRTDVVAAYEKARLGGSIGENAASGTFGLTTNGRVQQMKGFGIGGRTSARAASFLVGSESSRMQEFNRADAEMFRSFGFGEAKNMATVDRQEAMANAMQNAASSATAMVLSPTDKAAAAASLAGIGGSGRARIEEYSARMDKLAQAGGGLAEFARKFKSAKSDVERTRLIASFELGAGVSAADVTSGFTMGARKGVYSLTGAHTAGELEEMAGEHFARGLGTIGIAATKALGAEAMSESTRDMRARLLSDDADIRTSARAEAALKLGKLSRKGDLSTQEQAQKDMLKIGLAAEAMKSLSSSPGWDKLSRAEQVDKIRREMGKTGWAGKSVEQFLSAANASVEAVNAEQLQARQQYLEAARPRAQGRLSEASGQGGIIRVGKQGLTLSSAFEDTLRKTMGSDFEAASQFVRSSLAAEQDIMRGEKGGLGLAATAAADKSFSSISVEHRDQLLSMLGTSRGGQFIAAQRAFEQSVESGIAGGRRRYGKDAGGIKALAGMMGVQIDRKELRRLKSMSDAEASEFIESKLGVEEGKDIAGLREAVTGARKGVGGTSDAMRAISSEEVEKARIKKTEANADPIVLRGVKAQEASAQHLENVLAAVKSIDSKTEAQTKDVESTS